MNANWIEELLARPFDPEMDRLAKLAVAHKEAEEAKLAAMTPAERDAYIHAWAERIAAGEVEAACEYDRWANYGPLHGTQGLDAWMQRNEQDSSPVAQSPSVPPRKVDRLAGGAGFSQEQSHVRR